VKLLLAVLLGAAPQIQNRAPRPDELGYRPDDGAVVSLTPPSLAWIHEPAARTYTVQWATREDWSDAVTVAGIPWNVYTHSEPLAPGTYRWRYRFVDREGRVSDWSAARRFTVPPGAVPFPMPTRAERRERVLRGRPRLFVRPEDLPRLREAARGDRFAAIRAEADRLTESPPPREPEVRARAHDPATTHLWWPNRLRALQAGEEACTVAFAYLLTGEARYAEAARKRILELASWDPDGPTHWGVNCEAAKPILYLLPRAYDWAYDALTPDDRERVRRVLVRRATDAWKSGEIREGIGHLNEPYSSHGNRAWHKLAECAIALLGEIPEAETWLDYAVNKFYACYPVWSDDDGGWHEGVAYWAGYMDKVVSWFLVADRALGIDGLKKPFFSQVGDFPLYVAPPGSPNSGFGDLSYRPPSRNVGGFMEYFIRAMGARPEGARSAAWRWWCERWKMDGDSGLRKFVYDRLLPPPPEPRAPADLPPSKVFHGIGVASLHVTLLDATEDVHVLFKSSPFGSRSHGHNAQNGFQLNAYGEALLPACTFRDLHGSAFHRKWVWNTISQNSVLVDGRGQGPHGVGSPGRISAERLGPDWDYVAGDAAEAYEGRLTRFRRHVLLVKPDVVVLCDDLEAREPSTFQFLLHAYSAFEIDPARSELRVERPRAGAVIRYLSPVPLAWRQWDGYEPPPTREFPNLWHAEAATREKLAALRMLTVIVPHRAGRRAEWRAERTDREGAAGLRFERGEDIFRIEFPREGLPTVRRERRGTRE
jgi:hypothetical protein